MFWIYLLVFFVGTIFGSFGSVVVTRLADTVTRKVIQSCCVGRSHCPHCNNTLARYNLIPLVSFFIQRGACTGCRKKINIFYPILEFVSGIVFVGTVWFLFHQGIVHPMGSIPETLHILFYTPEVWYRLLINRLLVLLLVRDIHTRTLHMPIRIVCMGIAILGQFVFHTQHYGFILAIVFSLLFVGIFFAGTKYAQRKTKRLQRKGISTQETPERVLSQGFGEGDVRLSCSIGLLFGFIAIYHGIERSVFGIVSLTVSYMLVSSLVGIVFFLIYMVFTQTQKKTQTAFPFFPAMIIGFRLFLVWGNVIVHVLIGTP